MLGPLFEPQFSAHSYGFRPQRSARMALGEMERANQDGLRFAVDCDLKSFFDTVNHGLLMNRLTKRIGDRRVLGLIGRYLRLQVNQAKSKAARLNQCGFLGFELRGGKLRWTAHAVQRFKDRVRQITSRSSGRSMPDRLAELRRYVRGWLNYFGHSRTYNELIGLDQWLRRRVRLCYWKQWKRPRARRRNLLTLGIPRDKVKLASRSRKGYWRMSGNSIVQRALTKEWLWLQGVPNMRQQWIDLHYGDTAITVSP